MYGRAIREQFAITYARTGKANKALIHVLGKERAERMKPHTLRARENRNAKTERSLATLSGQTVAK